MTDTEPEKQGLRYKLHLVAALGRTSSREELIAEILEMDAERERELEGLRLQVKAFRRGLLYSEHGISMRGDKT